MPKKTDPCQTDMFVSDTRSHKYSVVIHPDWNNSSRIRELKQRLKDHIGRDPHDLNNPPHITLYECVSDICVDTHIQSSVAQAINGVKPFVVNIGEADYWDSGTFFLRIEEPKLIQGIALSIRQRIKPLKSTRIEGENGQTPHITISRFVTKKEMAQLPVSEFGYKAQFNCNSVTILKKAEGDKHSETLSKLKFS